MEITPIQWDAIYALKEKYAQVMDSTSDDVVYREANNAFTAITEVLTILGE